MKIKKYINYNVLYKILLIINIMMIKYFMLLEMEILLFVIQIIILYIKIIYHIK